MLCYAMLCLAVLHYALLSHAVLYHAVLRCNDHMPVRFPVYVICHC